MIYLLILVSHRERFLTGREPGIGESSERDRIGIAEQRGASAIRGRSAERQFAAGADAIG